ncbi:MAG: BrnT family toxin [Treponema sp.]|jgi:uncharacterized DUF497 family protein|nr:BrnT family toxin [Treponema sp.]
MKFIWDETKELANIKKHKVSFVQAVHTFYDPSRKEYYDSRHSSLEEDRSIVVGLALNVVLIVSFTEPNTETIRIISARKAKKHELEALYYGNS